MRAVTPQRMPWRVAGVTTTMPGRLHHAHSAATSRAASVDVLLLDNRDSFTFNLAQAFAELGADVDVVDADAVTAADVVAARAAGAGPAVVVVGPGPRGPADLPRLVELVRGLDGVVPLFGVCLGLQVIVRARGGVVERAVAPRHGKRSDVRHDGQGCFAGLPAPLRVMRYHSLVATALPASLVAGATDEDGQVMAVRDVAAGVEAVQFHPESVGTAGGMVLLRNVLVGAGVDVPAVVHRPGAVPAPEADNGDDVAGAARVPSEHRGGR